MQHSFQTHSLIAATSEKLNDEVMDAFLFLFFQVCFQDETVIVACCREKTTDLLNADASWERWILPSVSSWSHLFFFRFLALKPRILNALGCNFLFQLTRTISLSSMESQMKIYICALIFWVWCVGLTRTINNIL